VWSAKVLCVERPVVRWLRGQCMARWLPVWGRHSRHGCQARHVETVTEIESRCHGGAPCFNVLTRPRSCAPVEATRRAPCRRLHDRNSARICRWRCVVAADSAKCIVTINRRLPRGILKSMLVVRRSRSALSRRIRVVVCLGASSVARD